MDPSYYGLADAAIVGVAVLGFAIWQWVSVSREIERDKRKKSEDAARHPVGEHRLDDR